MISAQLFAQLEILVSKVIRRRSVYKLRPDGSCRPFGGLNVLLFGDWWQLKPVTGTALFTNPWDAPSFAAFHGLQLLWGPAPNAVRHCWDFAQSLRCADPWYNKFLNQCRYGNLTAEAYNMFHGFPTAAPVTISDRATGEACQTEGDACTCAADSESAASSQAAGPASHGEAAFYAPWVAQFLGEGASPEELTRGECAACARNRQLRARVLRREVGSDPRLQEPPFDAAPALYAYNVPRYCAVMLRAAVFARARGRRLHWCVARDIPLHRDDRDLPAKDLDAKRQRWLLRHDQQTMHIASSVPLVQGLPVRSTDCVDRKRFLFRGRRGFIQGWAPHPEETRQEVDGVLMLSRLLRAIYVKFPGATFRIADLPVGVHPLTPRSRTWLVNKATKVKARRTGFFLVPDFASTAHMIQGQSLEAAFADVVHANALEVATEELHVTAYVMLSRAKFLEQLWVLQSFGRQLFGRGPPVGPHVLLRKLRGEISAEDVQKACADADQEGGRDDAEKDPMKRLYRCTACFLVGRRDCRKPPQSFGAFSPTEILGRILEDGAWSRCLACRELADAQRTARGLPSLADTKGAPAFEPPEGETKRCGQCGLHRAPGYFSESQLHHEPRTKKRSAGLVCTVCRGIKRCDACEQWKSLGEFREGQDVCKTCQQLWCSHCGVFKAPGEFSAQSRHHFFTKEWNVQCAACDAAGRKVKDGAFRRMQTQPCDRCGQQLAPDRFRKAAGQRGTTCRDCEEIACTACGETKRCSCFDAQSVKNAHCHSQRVLCSDCHAIGRP